MHIDQTDARTHRRKAWAMVLAATIGVMCCAISVVMINTGLFIRPLQAEFGWSRGQVVASLSIGALVMAVANPFVGQLVDRLGTRFVIVMSQLGFGLATAAIPALVESRGIAGFYIGFALVALLGAGSTIVGYLRLLAGWFSGDLLSSRGLALGCCSAGVPLGAALSGPLTVKVIDLWGWQAGFYSLALLPLLIALPVSILAIREAPVHAMGRAGTAEVPGMTLAEACRTRTFWLLIALVLLIASCLQGQAIHMAPFMQDQGLSPGLFALMVTLIPAIGIPSRLIAGHLFDRYFAPRVAFVVFALPAAAALLMAGYPSVATIVIGGTLLGVGQGAESDLIGYLVSRYFGLKQSGRIFGTIYGAFMVGIAFGPFVIGRLFDMTHSYRVSFLAAGIGLGVICVLLLCLPRFPEAYKDRLPGAGH